MRLNSDFRDLLFEFNAAEVRYLVVGAYAVIFHAQPRYTKDLDVWVEPTEANAQKVFAALGKFGAVLDGVSAQDFARAGLTFQMGVPPNRIDVLTEIAAVTFADAWETRIDARYADQRIWVLGREHLLANKRAVGRPQDLLDIEKIEKSPG
jgi:hypothetical protein